VVSDLTITNEWAKVTTSIMTTTNNKPEVT